MGKKVYKHNGPWKFRSQLRKYKAPKYAHISYSNLKSYFLHLFKFIAVVPFNQYSETDVTEIDVTQIELWECGTVFLICQEMSVVVAASQGMLLLYLRLFKG